MNWAQSAAFSVAQADAYVRAQDWNGLFNYATRWSKASPNDPNAWAYLGNACGALHRWAEGADAARHATALKPDWAEAWHALGAAYVILGRNQDAIPALKRAIQPKSSNPSYYNNLAVAYSNLNDRNAALRTLNEEQDQAGHYMSSIHWYNLGNAYYHLLDLDKALAAYQQSLRMNQRYGDSWNGLGCVEQKRGHLNDALRDFKQAAALGDSLGNTNYANLQNANMQAQQEARRSGSNQVAVDRMWAGTMHTWMNTHDPSSGAWVGWH